MIEKIDAVTDKSPKKLARSARVKENESMENTEEYEKSLFWVYYEL